MSKTYSTATIAVQGNEQECIEVYSNESKEQTLGFVFDENTARLLSAAPDLLSALEAILPEFEMLYEEFDPDGQLGAWIEWSIMAQNAILKANGSEQ